MRAPLIPVSLVCLLLVASVHAAEPQQTQSPEVVPVSVPITVTAAESRDLEVWETSVGELESRSAPTIAAEVDGRIVAVTADVGQAVESGQVLAEIDPEDFRLAANVATADIERLQALIRAQELQVKRYRELVKKNSANQSALDDAVAQFGATRAQMSAARVRLQQAARNIARASITSPVSGKVDERKISAGDYVKTGTPLFHITTLEQLRAWLPFPESLASMLHVGLPVKLTTPVSPGHEVSATITDIRPEITRSSRAINVIVDLDNPDDWNPGASVTGAVRVDLHAHAVVVPETCIVRRPAGLVVYRVENDRVTEVPVSTGIRQGDTIEILSGVKAGDTLALDGAAYLNDGVAVRIQNTAGNEATK
jgi:membrane fusion protein (multidrug efflux system)